ncbi:type IV secretion system protein [Bartonella machadoae]|uniref:type IV secretion system protein n=1 Tax=Bartonella machadoae TaxID=2893471 RepID=UPI001F4C72D3|nr:type IV secretion system protein [Bartonella machadoae]UNE54099.1 type IV secretion system protein [Bartonella machadoae]
MSFTVFTQLFDVIDTATQTYITDISSKAIVTITPFVSIGLTIAFIAYAWLIMRGAIDMPASGFLSRCLRISIITSMALTAGIYQPEITNLIKEIPNDLLSTLIPEAMDNSKLANLLDTAASNGFDCAARTFEEAVFFDSDGVLYGFFGVLILLATSFLVAIGGAFVLLAKIALILLVGLGPIFIIALLWQPTYRLFEQWISQVLTYTILIVLLATVFSFMMKIFANFTQDFTLDKHYNIGYTVGTIVILSTIFIVLLLKIASIANALAKNITFAHLWKFSPASRKK